jgi:small subunit ribosomal protein S16
MPKLTNGGLPALDATGIAALKIRLRRMGRRNAPTYRIVVAESSMPRDGRIIASIGHYNPRTEPLTLSVDRARALEWLEKGARPTDTANALLKKAGIFRPEEEGVVATVTAAAKKGAKRVTGATKAAAVKVVEAVEDAAEKASEVAARVREAAGEAEETDVSPESAEASADAPDAATDASEVAASDEVEGATAEAVVVEEPKG